MYQQQHLYLTTVSCEAWVYDCDCSHVTRAGCVQIDNDNHKQNMPNKKNSSGMRKSLMVEWLGQVSQGHDIYCRDPEVMDSNPSRVKLGMRSTSVKLCLKQNYDHMCILV